MFDSPSNAPCPSAFPADFAVDRRRSAPPREGRGHLSVLPNNAAMAGYRDAGMGRRPEHLDSDEYMFAWHEANDARLRPKCDAAHDYAASVSP